MGFLLPRYQIPQPWLDAGKAWLEAASTIYSRQAGVHTAHHNANVESEGAASRCMMAHLRITVHVVRWQQPRKLRAQFINLSRLRGFAPPNQPSSRCWVPLHNSPVSVAGSGR